MNKPTLLGCGCTILLGSAGLWGCQEPLLNDDLYQYQKSRVYFDRQSYDTAARSFGEFVEHYGWSDKIDDARYYLAESHYFLYLDDTLNHSSRESAERSYLSIDSRSDRHVDALLGLAKLDYVETHSDSSASQIRGLLDRFPNSPTHPKIYLVLAETYQDRGKYDSSLWAFQQIVQKWSKSSSYDNALFAVGDLYAQFNLQDSAQYWYRRLIDELPQSSKADNATFEVAQLYRAKAEDWIQKRDLVAASLAQDSSVIWYRKVIQNYPMGGTYDNALYWLGDYYFAIRAYDSLAGDSARKFLSEYVRVTKDSNDNKFVQAKMKLMQIP